MDTETLSKICRISDDEGVISEYSVDASIFQVYPSKIAFPKNTKELKNLVRAVSENPSSGKVTLTPRAAGTCMSGGSLTEGIMVDMKEGFKTIGEIDQNKREVWVETGVYYRDLEKETLAHGLLFPPYTSSKDFCCIGGMIGNNASGEKSLRYGATVDNVLALKMVCSDGNEYLFGSMTEEELKEKMLLQGFEGDIYRKLNALILNNIDLINTSKPKVSKNAAGYDLWNVWNPAEKTFNIAKLIIGSQGTLGFVTSALLKLVTAPTHAVMIVLAIPTLSNLALGVQTILTHKPEGLETYDSHTYDLAKTYLPQDVKYTLSAKGANLMLFAQFVEETEGETLEKANQCVLDLKTKGFDAKVITDNAERDAHWDIRRMSYKLLKDHAPEGFVAVPVIEDTIVPIEHYGDFLRDLEKILEDYKMTYTFAGHIGSGSIRLIPLVDYKEKDNVEHIFELARRVYELTVYYKGSISVDHNDGLIRTPFLNLMFTPKMLQLFEETKNIFDPKGIFNPGKKVHGSLEYAKDHVAHKD